MGDVHDGKRKARERREQYYARRNRKQLIPPFSTVWLMSELCIPI